MAKWEKVGVARLSKSGKVVLVAVDEQEPHIWSIIDVEDLLRVIDRKKLETPIYCTVV